MSWTVQFIGKPQKVAAALAKASVDFDDQSKEEYSVALPHLVGLVQENFGKDYPVKITATCHSHAVDGELRAKQITASIELIYASLV